MAAGKRGQCLRGKLSITVDLGRLRSASWSDEIVAEIAAPHQNEGPHLAAGRARPGQVRIEAGREAKTKCSGKARPMAETEAQDPEKRSSPVTARSLPFSNRDRSRVWVKVHQVGAAWILPRNTRWSKRNGSDS